MRQSIFLTFTLLLLTSTTLAMVNPSLQPSDLSDRNRHVLVLKVKSIDGKTLTADVVQAIQGGGEVKTVSMNLEKVEDEEADDSPTNFAEGRLIVAWLSEKSRAGAKNILMYVGDRKWHLAQLNDVVKVDQWTWTGSAEETMVGTFNGQTERLVEMLVEGQKGKHFFPADVYAKFAADQVLATLPGKPAGVAIYDLNADGRLDLIAVSDQQTVTLLQSADGKFEMKDLGLNDARGKSIAIADANADGKADVLIDATLYLQGDKGFTKSSALPAIDNVKVSTFADLNNDAQADVVVSTTNGLQAFLNNKGTFTETQALRFAAGNGYITPGDWNADGRLDLFHAVGKGALLEQQADGTFAPSKQNFTFDFRGGATLTPALSGAGSFSPIWRDDRLDLLIPSDTGLNLLTREQGKLVDVTGFGNEIALATTAQSATLTEDLDMDGRVDLLTISREAANRYHTNRGYGSFMSPELYKRDFWPGESYTVGASGAAAGDVNSDGTNDLLLLGVDGKLRLVISDCLSLRKLSENPKHHLKVLQQTALLTVAVQGAGSAGARVTITQYDRVVALRTLGTSVLTGCRNPDQTTIAVREPGKYQLTVRFSDGKEQKQDVDLEPAKLTRVQVSRQP